jgi:hypothetical protein
MPGEGALVFAVTGDLPAPANKGPRLLKAELAILFYSLGSTMEKPASSPACPSFDLLPAGAPCRCSEYAPPRTGNGCPDSFCATDFDFIFPATKIAGKIRC